MSATEGRPAAQELSETRLRAFVDAVFDAYYDWHVQTGYMEMSSQMDRLLRLRPGALPRSFHAWLGRVHPDDRQVTLVNNQRAIEEGGLCDGRYRLRRGDGTYVQMHDRGVILRDEHDLAAHMIGAIRDITAEHEAERAMREAAALYETLFALGTDITEHRDLRRDLEATHQSLQRQAEALEDANTALRVILDQRNRDRSQLEHNIVDNVETMIFPLLDRLQRNLAGTPEAIYVDAVAANLRELVHPFTQTMDAAVGGDARLTRREGSTAPDTSRHVRSRTRHGGGGPSSDSPPPRPSSRSD